MEEVLLLERRDGIATVTLNRPSKLNSLSRDLRRELVKVFAELSTDDAVDVVILTGKGRAFCAGLDLKELSGDEESQQAALDDRERASVVAGADVVRAVETFPGPVIGAINGFAITGGFELALACDVLLASTEARFADTHARVGILPGWGLSQKLSRTIGVYRAKELSFSGNFLGAEQALQWGLVNRVVAPERLLENATALARDMRSCPRDVVRAYKRLIDEGSRIELGKALELEAQHSRAHIESVSSEQIRARRVAVQQRGREQN